MSVMSRLDYKLLDKQRESLRIAIELLQTERDIAEHLEGINAFLDELADEEYFRKQSECSHEIVDNTLPLSPYCKQCGKNL